MHIRLKASGGEWTLRVTLDQLRAHSWFQVTTSMVDRQLRAMYPDLLRNQGRLAFAVDGRVLITNFHGWRRVWGEPGGNRGRSGGEPGAPKRTGGEPGAFGKRTGGEPGGFGIHYHLQMVLALIRPTPLMRKPRDSSRMSTFSSSHLGRSLLTES